MARCCTGQVVPFKLPWPEVYLSPSSSNLTFEENPCPGYDGGTAGLDGGSRIDGGVVDGGAMASDSEIADRSLDPPPYDGPGVDGSASGVEDVAASDL